MSLDDVVATLRELRELRDAEAEALRRKRQVIRAYAVEAKAAGVSGRQLASHLQAALRERGWTAEQIRQVGISPGAVDVILSGG